MVDTTKKTVAKVSGLGTVLVTVVTQIPEPYAHWVVYILALMGAVGLICTQIPAPEENSRWRLPYKLVSYLASNWSEAANAAILLKSNQKK